MANPEQALERYMRGQFVRVRGKPLVRMMLRNAASGSKGIDVDGIDIPETVSQDEIPSMVDDIIMRAQQDADGLGGVQRYVLQFFEEGNAKPVGRWTFRLRGEEDAEWDETAGEEAPTNKGLLQQLMRHNEALTRTVATSAGTLTGVMARRMESLESVIEKLVNQRQKDLILLEESRSQQHERDMQLMVTSNQEERKDKLLGKVEMLLPALLYKLTGHKILPGDTDPQTVMIKELVKSLDGEQIKRIMFSLKPEQQIVMAQFFQAIKHEESRGSNGTS